MRKLIFVFFIVAGALVGVLSAVDDDWTLQVAMAALGALVGTAIGGALAGRRHRARRLPHVEVPGMSASMTEIAANAWRDRGYPAFAKPWDALPDRRMFDPDKIE